MKVLTYLLFVAFGSFTIAQNTYYVSASTLNLRSEASSSSEIVSKLSQHEILRSSQKMNIGPELR